MPSSPIADAVAQQDRASQLLDLLATVPDPGNRAPATSWHQRTASACMPSTVAKVRPCQ